MWIQDQTVQNVRSDLWSIPSDFRQDIVTKTIPMVFFIDFFFIDLLHIGERSCVYGFIFFIIDVSF